MFRLAEKHGLKLVEKLTFDEFYAKNKESGRHLLQKINGLEVSKVFMPAITDNNRTKVKKLFYYRQKSFYDLITASTLQ
jgi:hypothetical protein